MMHTPICQRLGIEFPLFAFSHCRDVVAAVSKAGGMGILGVAGYSTDRLKQELDWIEARVGGKPYGVDLIVPNVYEGKGASPKRRCIGRWVAVQAQRLRDKYSRAARY